MKDNPCFLVRNLCAMILQKKKKDKKDTKYSAKKSANGKKKDDGHDVYDYTI